MGQAFAGQRTVESKQLYSSDRPVFSVKILSAMEKLGASTEPLPLEFFEPKKSAKNRLVPIGALLTAGVLTAGLISFRQGNSQLGQKLMRARVVVQGATVALMAGSAYFFGENLKSSKEQL